MNFLYHMAKGIGGGFCIGIGGTAFLFIENNLIGAAVFSVGLFSIYFFGLNLYTGKVGYLVCNSPKYAINEVLSTWIGNFLGAIAVAELISATHRGQALAQRASEISAAKLSASYLSLLILSSFCGLMVYFAVDMYRRYHENDLTAAIFYSVLCVVAFLVCGFEHSIADIYFFSMAGRVLKNFPEILLISIGNLVGGCLGPATETIYAALKKRA